MQQSQMKVADSVLFNFLISAMGYATQLMALSTVKRNSNTIQTMLNYLYMLCNNRKQNLFDIDANM